MRKYSRTEKIADITITEFDGEGFISPRLADSLAKSHNSFQIRMPYIKGVVHKVDFASLLSELDVPYIVDMWGNKHNPNDIDIILTDSMFKGLKWMKDNNLTWAECLKRCREYDHALYISGMDKLTPQNTTELNYQFLNTLSITNEEFRPADLPLGWQSSPEYDSRQWVTKTTETEYYRFIADNESRRRYFTDYETVDIRRKHRAELIAKNPLFIDEPVFAKELNDKAENIIRKYSVGQLLVSGDNRYLSDDLVRLAAHIVKQTVGESLAYSQLQQEFLSDNFIYAPNPNYMENEVYTLLRSPHIARNEEALVKPVTAGYLRNKYFSHLSYVIMVDSHSLIPERLGGADFDGDMVKTIADPLINKCVMRSSTDLPLLKIPTAEPLIADANDWYERFTTVKNIFSSRIGQISNAALSRGVIAYDENTDAEDKEKYYHEVESLAILTGLEIDSAKSGIKPDLSEYIEKKNTKRSIFLRYKAIVDREESHKWYAPTKNARLKKYFSSVDWSAVSSNLERLPYFAYMLEKETEKSLVIPVSDEQLFTFAREPGWKDKLNPDTLKRVENLIKDYHEALKRVRSVKHISADMKRKNDIYRILYARGQEKTYSVDELYSVFDSMTSHQVRKARLALDEVKWCFISPEERQNVLYSICRTAKLYDYSDVFCDFRSGGYRIVGDIICDFDDMYRKIGIQKNITRKGDSKELKRLLAGVENAYDYKEQIVRNCMNIIRPADKKNCLDYTDVVKCAVALGERQFVLEVLPSVASDLTIDEPKKKWRLW